MAFPWQATVQDHTGAIMALAEVTVRNSNAGGSLATLYSDEAGTPMANPFDADANGLAQFWAETGTYYIEGSLGGQTTDGWFTSLGGGSAVLTVTAAEAVGSLKAVTSDGYLCDIADVDKLGGISQAAGAIGEGVNLVTSGPLVDGGWTWTADQPIFVADSGVLTQTDPGNSRRVAWAVSDTEISVDIFPTGTAAGGSGKEGELVFTNSSGFIAASLLDLSALYADPAADPASDNDGLIPLLDAAGLLPSEYVPVTDISTNTGGSGKEDTIIRTDGNGDIDPSLLGNVVNVSKQFTADGAITAGDAVSLTADKTVTATALVAGSFAFSEQSAFSALGVQPHTAASAFSTVAGVFCHAYRDDANDDITVSLGTATGTTITYGTATVIAAGTFTAVAITYCPINDVFILCYADASNTYAQAFSISGTSVDTIGTAVTLRAGTSFSVNIAAATTGDQFVAVYSASNSTVYARGGEISGTTISMGTEITINGGDNNSCGIVYNPSEDKYVVFVGDDTNNQLRTYVITATLSALSSGSAVNITSATTPGFWWSAACSPTGQIVVGYPSSSSVFKLAAGTVSGTSCTWTDTEQTFGTSGTARYPAMGYNPTDDEFGVVYTNANATGGSGNEFSILTVAAGSITEVSINKITGIPAQILNSNNSTDLPYDVDEGVYSCLIKQGNPTMYETVIDPAASVTNADKFIGFAEATVADGATVNVSLLGDVNQEQSALTFNIPYFVGADGDLYTTDQGYGGGRAMGATDLLVLKSTW